MLAITLVGSPISLRGGEYKLPRMMRTLAMKLSRCSQGALKVFFQVPNVFLKTFLITLHFSSNIVMLWFKFHVFYL
jgi:hypothetical protein